MTCSECNIETKKARPVNGGILCNSCHHNYNRNILEIEVMQLIRNHETETYPRGVGSIFRCIKSDNYSRLADSIIELLTNKLNQNE